MATGGRRRSLGPTALLAVLLVVTGALAAVPAADLGAARTTQGAAGWAQHQADAANTGFDADAVGPRSIETTTWAFNTTATVGPDDLVPAIRSSAVAAGGRVYVGGGAVDGSAMYALDFSSGEVVWTYDTDGTTPGVSAPAVADGVVYVGDHDGTVHAVDGGSGEAVWTAETAAGTVVTEVTVHDGTVYLVANDPARASGHVHAFDAESGERLWTARVGLTQGTPAVADGRVYVGGGFDRSVHAFDAETGEAVWSVETDGTVYGSPAVVDGTVYAASGNGTVYALGAADGSRQWTAATDGAVTSSPAVADGTVVVGTDAGSVYAFGAAGGGQQWRRDVGGPVHAAPSVAGGTVYVGGFDGSLSVLDLGSGDRLDTFDAGGPVWTSPAVVDGTVVAGSEDGTLYALTGPEGSPADGGGDDEVPGFGAVAALLAVLAGGWLHRRR